MHRTSEPTLGFMLFPTALGHCGIGWSAHAITGCQLPDATAQQTEAVMHQRFAPATPLPPPAWVAAVVADVQALLAGDASAHARLAPVPLDMALAPPFHREVWEAARRIPLGETLLYGELASLLGQPGAARAVGQALGANPFAPIVPCHRILAKGHSAGGFSAPGGIDMKLRMLEIERAQFGAPGLFDGV